MKTNKKPPTSPIANRPIKIMSWTVLIFISPPHKKTCSDSLTLPSKQVYYPFPSAARLSAPGLLALRPHLTVGLPLSGKILNFFHLLTLSLIPAISIARKNPFVKASSAQKNLFVKVNLSPRNSTNDVLLRNHTY